ncbi:hypothetical protein [Halalkalibacter urbisdiaboli]|uniref:hypothetical protein n=1 Tax=Halalkalibacter urbisdiaboli TaxID=1960589 RepID=UPI000B44563D|nr:hypothetical protein [Halalkalibacter urbisdiaboli]
MLKKISLLMLMLSFFLHDVSVYAQLDKNNNNSTQAVLIIVPSFSVMEAEWLWKHGEKSSLWENAAFAAMNVRPEGPYSYLNNMVSLSTGKKGLGVQEWNGYEGNEEWNGVPVRELVLQWRGTPPKQNIVHPQVHRLIEKNQQSAHRAEVGLLGTILNESNIKRFVLGHSDTHTERIRYGPLFTMDYQGETEGDLLAAVKKNESVPSGMEMNHDFIIQHLEEHATSSHFTVVEWGDIHRLFEQKPLMKKEHFHSQYERQLIRLENFIHRVMHTVDKNVWLVAPMMHQEAYDAKQQLAPVFYWHSGKGGFLTSDTTRQSYVVSNLDIVPSILATFQIPRERSLPGQEIKIENIGTVDKQVGFTNIQEMVDIFATRGSVLSIYITCLVLLLLVSGLGTVLARGKDVWVRIIKIVLIAGWSSPLWFLLLTIPYQEIGVTGFVLLLTACSLGCGYLFESYFKQSVVLIGAILFITITIDLLLGSPLMQRSYLGYDPIIGARYYGIGNEYAGVYIITALACLVPLFKSKRRRLVFLAVIIMMLFQLVMLGKNTLGTNAGATLSAGVAYLFVLFLLIRRKISLKVMLFVCLIAGSLSLGLLYLLQLSGSQSHIGMAFERLTSGDFLYITDTIQRKLAMNIKIFRHSNWTQLFITSYILGAIILWRRRMRVEEYEERVFLQGGVIASFALLLLNDSGVVAAATSMFCVVSAHYYWLLTHSEGKEEEQQVRM